MYKIGLHTSQHFLNGFETAIKLSDEQIVTLRNVDRNFGIGKLRRRDSQKIELQVPDYPAGKLKILDNIVRLNGKKLCRLRYKNRRYFGQRWHSTRYKIGDGAYETRPPDDLEKTEFHQATGLVLCNQKPIAAYGEQTQSWSMFRGHGSNLWFGFLEEKFTEQHCIAAMIFFYEITTAAYYHR